MYILLFLSCSETQNGNTKSIEGLSENRTEILPCINDSLRNNSYIWYTNFDSKGEIILIKGKLVDSTKNINDVIEKLNKRFEVKLKIVGIKKDTLSVKILNEIFFSQQIGSTGVSEFILSSLYTLTECFGIKYVNYIFIEGDHSGEPGIRDRNHHHVQSPKYICW